jgi:hypothetical protein
MFLLRIIAVYIAIVRPSLKRFIAVRCLGFLHGMPKVARPKFFEFKGLR